MYKSGGLVNKRNLKMQSKSQLVEGRTYVVTGNGAPGHMFALGTEVRCVDISGIRERSSGFIRIADGSHQYININHVEELDGLSLDVAKANLAATQAAYDKASDVLDKAKAAFKSADEAHGNAMKAYDKVYREAEAEKAKFTEADLKDVMVVEAKWSVFSDDKVRLLVRSGSRYLALDSRGTQRNSFQVCDALLELNATYTKTDAQFSVK